jgi:hypothetical protein
VLNPVSFTLSTYSTLSTLVSPLIELSSKHQNPQESFQNGIGIEEAFETLRQAEKDRERDIDNPNDNSLFESSDDEATYSESDLFAHLIQDVAELDHEKEELDTKLCDLVASNWKHKTSRKNIRTV